MSAPLPFVGQKRMFAREYIKVLEQFKDCTVFVDLFGGSGLLSHITKQMRPDAKVVYNDFDNYRKRLENIPRTNLLLADFRLLLKAYHGISRLRVKRGKEYLNVLDWKRKNGDMLTILPYRPPSCSP